MSSFVFAGRLVYVRNSQEYTVTSGISLLTTGISASGGESIEGVESIKKFAPRIYASQNRALTANDYETLIPARIYPETESISVFGGEEVDTEPTAMMQDDVRKAPTIHAELWKPLKVLAKDDIDMQRAYGRLPDTNIQEEK